MERIANGKANAENFEKTVRAIEEGDKKVETARYACGHIHMNCGVGYWQQPCFVVERLCAEEAEEEGGGERWLSCMNALECWKEHFGARWRSVAAVDGQRRLCHKIIWTVEGP